MLKAGFDPVAINRLGIMPQAEKFAKLLIEETLKQVDEQCYGRGENQWYYEDDKRWIRMHFDNNKEHINKNRGECNDL